MKIFSLPVFPPFDAGQYPVHEPYDIDDPEPTRWRLQVALASDSDIPLRAVCDGYLSTVPPWEMKEREVAYLHKVDSTLPGIVTVYLEPVSVALQAVNKILDKSGLGSELLCFVYQNADGQNFAKSLLPDDTPLPYGLTPASALELFAWGDLRLWVNQGSKFGQAAPRIPDRTQQFLLFGVLTSAGFVDPVVFFRAVALFLKETSEVEALAGLVTTRWPFLGNSSAEVLASAVGRLYPAPVLLEAKKRLALSGTDWGAIGILQKKLYWQRLLVSAGHATSGPAFLYNLSDIYNRFQLEAVAEFFLAWREPALGGQPPADFPSGSSMRVDLRTGWHIVIIDPFDHQYLGPPALPKPDYSLSPYEFEGDCLEDNVPSVVVGTKRRLLPDQYRGVLFLVFNGEIRGYYRWTTYSAHKWENPEINHPDYLSSVLGNVRYKFYSWTSSSLPVLNYGFRVYNPLLVNERTDGRFYFQQPVRDDPDGKGEVMVHIGYTRDTLNPDKNYNGSGGCIASPSLPRMRRRMAEIYLANTQAPKDIRVFVNATHRQCVLLWTSALFKLFDNDLWNHTIEGDFWIVHPDEPTTK